MRLQVTGQDQFLFQIGGSKLTYKIFNLIGFWGRYWFLVLGLVLGIIGIIGSSALSGVLTINVNYWLITVFCIVLGFILSWKFEIKPGSLVTIVGVLSLIPLVVLVFGLDFMFPDLQITVDGNPVTINLEQLFFPIVLFELLVIVLLVIFLNPPPPLLLDPMTRELKIRDESYIIAQNALIQINRNAYTKSSRSVESSSSSFNLEWELFLTQVGENDTWIHIPLYRIKRSSPAFFLLKNILVTSNSKKWDGWINETADQLSTLLDLEIRTNSDASNHFQ